MHPNMVRIPSASTAGYRDLYFKPASLLLAKSYPLTKLFNRMHPSEPCFPLLLVDGLGEGSFAYVYLCRDPNPPNKLMGALKVFKSPRYVKMAMQEANNLKKINHPSAVKIYESGSDGFIADL